MANFYFGSAPSYFENPEFDYDKDNEIGKDFPKDPFSRLQKKDPGKFTIEKSLSFLGDFLNRSGQNKYQEEAKSRGRSGARVLEEDFMRGSGYSSPFSGFAVENRPYQPPIFIAGQDPPESRNRFAGAAMGALKGFMAGAATGMPHMAGIGAVAGGLQGGFG